jgi:3-hydroxyacyl-[acyl-carrier-protein] dehydratase
MVTLDIDEIRKIIPQRYPFLMIDRIIDIDPWKRAIAVKNISINEPYFQGHFPEMPIMPGVLIIEAIAQTTGILYKYQNKLTELPKYEILLGSVKSRFLQAARPGDQILIEATAEKFISTGGTATGVCTVEDKVICSAEISFAVKNIPLGQGAN